MIIFKRKKKNNNYNPFQIYSINNQTLQTNSVKKKSNSPIRKGILFNVNPSTKAIVPYGFFQSSGLGFGLV